MELQQWILANSEIERLKASYFEKFRALIVEKQYELNQKFIIANLWRIVQYYGGIGGSLPLRLCWSLSNGFNRELFFEFSVGKGIEIRRRRYAEELDHDWHSKLKEIFSSEDGWFTTETGILGNNSFFEMSYPGGVNFVTFEMWLLGNETEKYADHLFGFLQKYLLDERVIHLFLEYGNFGKQ